MSDNNAFGQEIDDDGLPRYSPDRNNVAAYHMFKMGLSETMPDPEDTHTPFFRTPSYYAEKAEKERQKREGQFNTLTAGENPEMPKPPDAVPRPSVKLQEGFKPDTRPERTEASGSGTVPSSAGTPFQEVFGKVRDAYVKEFLGEKRLADPAFGTVPLKDFPPEAGSGEAVPPKTGMAPRLNRAPGQEFSSGRVRLPFQSYPLTPLPSRPDESRDDPEPAAAAGAVRAVLPVPDLTGADGHDEGLESQDGSLLKRRLEQWLRDSGSERPAAVPLGLAREPLDAGHVTETENGDVSLTGSEPMPVETGFGKEDVAAGWMGGESGLADDGQAGMGFSMDGLEAPSAGKGQQNRAAGKGFRPVFRADNPANPGFQPMQVAIVTQQQLPIPKGRREVTIEMTNGLNAELTRLNRGYAIGINFTVLSRLEGGSAPYANLPIGKKELDMERRERDEALKRGEAPPVRKWSNNSGATIGSGFDLGQTSVEEMRRFGFPESLVQKCIPYVGKKRLDAEDMLRKRPLVLTDQEIDIVNRQVMGDKAKRSIEDWDSRIAVLKRTRPDAPYFHEMNSAQQTIVFSRYYHQGPGWHNRRSNAPMFEAMTRNDWQRVNREMQGLINRSGPKWLKGRFWKEKWFLNWAN